MYNVQAYRLTSQDKTHLMHYLGVLLLYRGRQRSPSHMSLLRLASTRIQANEACSAM